VLTAKFSCLDAIIQQQRAVPNLSHSNGIQSNSGGDVPTNLNKSHYWGGRFHCVPDGFEMPIITVKQLWDYWMIGNKALDIVSLRFVVACYDFPRAIDRTNFSKAYKVMEALLKICRDNGDGSLNDILKLPLQQSDNIFEKSYKQLISYDDTCKRRYSEYKYTYVYRLILEGKK
jgi:hypothetical protein